MRIDYKNKVELLDYMGSDKHHSLAAWASTFFDMGLEFPKDPKIRVDQIVDYILSKSKKMRSIESLLDYLAVEGHESPFRMSSFMFGMTTDVATHIQKLKHAVILEAENAESAKYKELKEDKFYLPEDWMKMDVLNPFEYSGYPEGAFFEGKITGNELWSDVLYDYTKLGNFLYHKCLEDLTPRLGRKRAKETARYFKTYNSQINSVNKFSFAGIMTFYNKRSVEFAQEEIKDIANQMIQCVREIPGNPFKYSLKAFNL